MSPQTQQLEQKLKILEKIARMHSETSEEHETLKLAAEALLFINHRGHLDEFTKYVGQANQELTEEQMAYLKNIGCAP